MDDTEEEKVQLLESLRLQDAALSATVGNSIVTLNSDSDSEEGGDQEAGIADPETSPAPAPSFEELKDLQDSVTDCVSPEGTEEILLEENNAVDSEPSWADALEANQEYDAVLAQVEAELRMNIAKVSKQLEEVQTKINTVSNKGSTLNIKSHWLYPFGMPYFKTGNFYPCPFNEDYNTKKRNNEICWSDLPPYHQWIPRYKKILSRAVRELSLKKCVSDAILKCAIMRKELESAMLEGNSEKAVALERDIASFNVDAVAETMVDDVVANGEHDWLLISVKYLEGKQTPESCRSFWYMYLHPAINKAPYSEEEEQQLLSLAEKYKQQDWENIAKELGTNRSGYQCFIVYQNKLNSSLRKNTWNASEDQKLLQSIEKCRIGDFIPWGKVAYYMDGRTKTQVFNRWTYSLNPIIKKGRFSQEEDIMILAGVQMWGEDFQRISNFLQDRTTVQVRDRYKHYLNRPGLGVPWTVEDDEKLLKLAVQFGKNWVKIAQRFPSKDRTQVRHRYATLAKWREKNDQAPLTDAPSRCFNPQVYKDFQSQWDKAKSILNCGTMEEMVKAKNSLVTSLMKHKRKMYHDTVKKKKPSVIETDLVNYFRCSYDVPGARRKLQLKTGEAQKYAEELAVFLPLMKAELNLPSAEEIAMDSSLSLADREILKAYLSAPKPVKIPHPNSECSEEEETPILCDETNTSPAPLFGDGDDFNFHDFLTNIDYTPTHDLASLYINLPLMNFDQDQVVADRNQDPSFFEPPVMEPFVPNKVVPTKRIVKESYICPPNLTTLVGLRTFLLNRRNLLTWSNLNLAAEKVYGDVKLEEIKQKFDERMMCLFLWPALMSRFGPSSNRSIFLEDEAEEAPIADFQNEVFDCEESQNYTPMAKESLKAIPSTSQAYSIILRAPEPEPVPSTSRSPRVPTTPRSHGVPSTSPKSPKVPSTSSKSPKVPHTLKSPKVPRTSKSHNVPSTSESPVVCSTSKSPKVPRTSKSPKVPRTSKSPKVPRTSKSPKVPRTSKSPRISGPPQKRQKIVTEEDIDDPDFI